MSKIISYSSFAYIFVAITLFIPITAYSIKSYFLIEDLWRIIEYHEERHDYYFEGLNENLGLLEVVEGRDLTEILGVVKYEKPLPANLAGMARGNFPSFVPKTDEERIQNCFGTLKNKWINHHWEVTMKLDGSSFTCYYRTHPDVDGGQFGVCSRNLDLQESEGNAFWQAARFYDLEAKMCKLGRSIAIQGELMGPGIQGNKENLTSLELFVFNVYDIDRGSYLSADDRYEIVDRLGLSHVPIERISMKFEPEITKEEILGLADGPSLNAKFREGLVFKSRTDPSISFKVISNRWLLKNDE